MNPQQTENLKKLIRVSPVLNSSERDEWLMLLELMNDKQMQELEKILSSNQPVSQSTFAPNFAKASSGFQKATTDRSASQPISNQQISSQPLSHIINLPKISETPVMQKPQSRTVSLPEKIVPTPLRQGFGGQGFFTRIKSILAEKELPPGNSSVKDELKLMSPAPFFTPHAAKAVTGITRKPPVVPHPKPKFKAETQLQNKPSQISKPQGFAGIENLYPHLKVAQDSFPAKPVQSSGIETSKEVPMTLANILAQPKPSQVQQTAVLPHKPGPLQSARKNIAEPGKKGLEKWPLFKGSLPKQELKPVPKENNEARQLIHQSLKDLAVLTPEKFGEKNNNLVLSIKQLIKEFGYYEVIFNLEKSPLFKSYIETGLNILSGKANFENSGQLQDRHYLSRPQFEQFIDFLKQIQAG